MSPLQLQTALAALAIATQRIKITNLQGVEGYEAPSRAAALARTGRYFCRMRNGRVTNMHEVREKPAHRADGYRTTGGAPALPVTQEWIWRVCGRPGRTMTEVVTACDIPVRG